MITKYDTFIGEDVKWLNKTFKKTSDKFSMKDKFKELNSNFEEFIKYLDETYIGKDIKVTSTAGWEELIAFDVKKFGINSERDYSFNVYSDEIYIGKRKLQENEKTSIINLKDEIVTIEESDEVRRFSEDDPYGEEEWNESKINEYVEFVKTDDVLKLKGFYQEFEDYVAPFLQKGEWYRIVCFEPKEKKESYLKDPSKHKFGIRNKPKMLLFVIRFNRYHSDYGSHYIQYDKIYDNGEVTSVDFRSNYITFHQLTDYKNVVFQRVESPELKKMEEELRKLNIKHDPYGEEEWND